MKRWCTLLGLVSGCMSLRMTRIAHLFRWQISQTRSGRSQRTCTLHWLQLRMPCTLVKTFWDLKFLHNFPTIKTGEDVGVYATGPGSNLVQGVFEQSYIPYIISYSSCIGPLSNKNPACLGRSISSGSTPGWSKHSVVLTVAASFFCVFWR